MSSTKSWLARTVLRIVREPLVHFLVAGGILFALLSGGAEEAADPAPANRIEVTDQTVAGLAQRIIATWRRQPTQDELARLVDEYVREEICVRDARPRAG
jgi:hypothetical protein